MKNKHLVRPILATASFLALAIPANMGKAQAQSYETFSVNGGMALNTNNNFRLIDGQPRMAIWQHNISDVDQQFQRIAQSDGSFLLRQRSTGKCLNAYRLWNGAEVNVWPCSSSDPDQKFRLTHLGNGAWQIKRNGTNLCVDSPTRSNGGIVHLWACDANQPNQRWQSSLPVSTGNLVVRPFQQYFRGANLRASNGYRLSFQTDGNLVLYTPSNYAIWATGTVGNLSSRLAIQSDGNIVLYDNSNRPMWASNTAGNTNAFLAIQTDGNMVVYTSDGSRPLFATNTVGGVRRVLNAATIWGQTHSPSTSGMHRNPEAFYRWAKSQVGISRLDRSDLRGQCVTLIARYIQEVYLTGSQRTAAIAFGHGKDTARVVAGRWPNFFTPVTNQGLPQRGAIISFPDIGIVGGVRYGHVAIVMEARQLSNGQRQVRILDSNGDSRGQNSNVREYTYWINIPDGTAQRYGRGIYWTNPR